MGEEVNKYDFYELLSDSPVAIQAILRGLQSIANKVMDGADVSYYVDSDSVSLSCKKSELHVYYKKENEETATIIAVYKKKISKYEVMFKRGKIRLARHLAGQIFEATRKIAEALEFGNVTTDIIAEVFGDVLERVNRFLSDQHEKPSEVSQAGDGEDDASGDEAETTGRRG